MRLSGKPRVDSVQSNVGLCIYGVPDTNLPIDRGLVNVIILMTGRHRSLESITCATWTAIHVFCPCEQRPILFRDLTTA